jgi:hypothetical protein
VKSLNVVPATFTRPNLWHTPPGTMAVMTCLTPLPLHLGALHPYELLLVLVIAFGPFVVLAGVVFVLRRRDIAREQSQDVPG